MNNRYLVLVEVSNKHLHLSQKHLEILFGEDYELSSKYYLSQAGEFAANETVDIKYKDKTIENVRIVGPIRTQTQIELLNKDSQDLYGEIAPLRLSGDLKETFGATLIGPKGQVEIEEGVIIAQNHIHLSKFDSEHFNLKTDDKIDVHINDQVFKDIAVRVGDTFRTTVHIDKEEAESVGVKEVGVIGALWI